MKKLSREEIVKHVAGFGKSEVTDKDFNETDKDDVLYSKYPGVSDEDE